MRTAAVPDCRHRPPIEGLDARQRAEVVRLLAEKGPEALEAWLRLEAQRDPSIRTRLARHRARLERAARAESSQREEEAARRRRGLQSTWEARAAESARAEEALRQRIARAMGAPVLHLEDLGLAGPGDEGIGSAQPAVKPGPAFGARVRAWWGALLLWWAKLLSWHPGKTARSTLRLGAEELDLWALAKNRPGLLVQARRHARNRGWWSRLRAWWRRLLGREDALEDLRRMLQDQAEQARRRHVLLAEEVRREAEQGLEGMRQEAQRDAETRRRELEELEAAQRKADAEWQERRGEEPYRSLTEDVLGELAEVGLVDAGGKPTERLLQRFSSMLFDETLRGIAEGGPATPGTYRGGEGEYERGAMASLHEMGAMELVETVVRARTRHPHVRHIQDDDVIVHRETRSTRAHVVVVFDHSNSMEANDRMEAAKKVCLVLHRALLDDDPSHRIDLVAMGTSVRRVGLAECWSAQPSGFTNHGAALREARRLLETSDADRRLVYLITDGLPEARTLPDGRDVADRVDACMPDALKAAKALRDMGGVRLLILQLELSDPKYLKAAADIAKAGGGRVVGLDPKELAKTLLVDLREQAHAVPVAA